MKKKTLDDDRNSYRRHVINFLCNSDGIELVDGVESTEPQQQQQQQQQQQEHQPSEVDCSSSVASPTSTSPSDSDWEPVVKASGRQRRTKQPPTAATPRSRKPYERQPKRGAVVIEDRKQRKKEQNKTAATRYRIKKKAELDVLLDEEDRLQKRNQQLQSEYDTLRSEVVFVKNLLRDVLKRSASS